MMMPERTRKIVEWTLILTLLAMAAQLFAVKANDPMVFGSVAITLAVAGLAACIVPARRATKADPIAALRME